MILTKESEDWFYEMVKNLRKEQSGMNAFWYNDKNKIIASRYHGWGHDSYNWVGSENVETLNLVAKIIKSKS